MAHSTLTHLSSDCRSHTQKTCSRRCVRSENPHKQWPFCIENRLWSGKNENIVLGFSNKYSIESITLAMADYSFARSTFLHIDIGKCDADAAIQFFLSVFLRIGEYAGPQLMLEKRYDCSVWNGMECELRLRILPISFIMPLIENLLLKVFVRRIFAQHLRDNMLRPGDWWRSIPSQIQPIHIPGGDFTDDAMHRIVLEIRTNWHVIVSL